jgi:hypothetical protein
MDQDAYKRSCALLGVTTKYEEVPNGSFGVKFLARIYSPNVWFGDTNSTCDLNRQLSKFHTCTALPNTVTAIQKLVEKCRGFCLSDPNTPILGPFTTKVVALAQGMPTVEVARALAPYSSLSYEDDQYPNSVSDWAEHYATEAIPGLNIPLFNAWLDIVESLDEMLSPPLLVEPKPPVYPTETVVLDTETNYAVNSPVITLAPKPRAQGKTPTTTNDKRNTNQKQRAKNFKIQKQQLPSPGPHSGKGQPKLATHAAS